MFHLVIRMSSLCPEACISNIDQLVEPLKITSMSKVCLFIFDVTINLQLIFLSFYLVYFDLVVLKTVVYGVCNF